MAYLNSATIISLARCELFEESALQLITGLMMQYWGVCSMRNSVTTSTKAGASCGAAA